MATIVLSTIGTALGGPLGSTIGALIGNRIDHAIGGGGPAREGPRLKELSVTTSSYGTAIARHYGKVRAAGSVLWATDLVESKDTEGGGKSRPSVTTYSYSISLAVALSSRPIETVRRVWADGNLLRGAAGDLKVGGEMRLYSGHGDQAPDPLIASDRGPSCPAFRGIAYCVFESLDLAEFGNRVPAMTFEVVADNGVVSLVDLVQASGIASEGTRPLPGLGGYSEEGGALAAHLQAIDTLYPMSLDAGGDGLSLEDATGVPTDAPLLPEPVADASDGSFGPATGSKMLRAAAGGPVPTGLRYYDPERDYQPGLQRADGRARSGRPEVIEFPATIHSDAARTLINAAAHRAAASRDTLSWRIAEIDPSIRPGSFVRVPGRHGIWIVDSWEWRDTGVELSLRRRSGVSASDPPGYSGAAAIAQDNAVTPTRLLAFEVPWSGAGSSSTAEIYAAASSTSRGWNGAALFAVDGATLQQLGSTSSRRCITGYTLDQLMPSQSSILDRDTTLEIELDANDFSLSPASAEQLAKGNNRALVGTEIIQFAHAVPLGGSRWRLGGLLRGRGAIEAEAMLGQSSGASFALLDGSLTKIDPVQLGNAARIAAIGLADEAPAEATILGLGRSLRPLIPVHAQAILAEDGSLHLSWTRRARGAWAWNDEVDVPLVEESESYIVGVGPVASPLRRWTVTASEILLDAATIADLSSAHPGASIFVRQLGKFGLSDPLLLTVLQEP